MDPLRKYPHIIQLFACIVNLFVVMFLLKLSHPIVNHPNLISSRMLGAVDVLPLQELHKITFSSKLGYYQLYS